MSGLTTQI